jgi:signal transduction histidine kinase
VTVGRFDPDRIGAAVSNLLGNALQHGAAGTKIRLRIDGTEAQMLRMRVANEGVIPEAVLATLFQPFHASGPGGQHHGGLGLGLYIVQQFVAAHGGTVRANSGEPEGTVFDVTLPRDPGPSLEAEGAAP